MTHEDVALLLQMALFGEVGPALRGVTFGLGNDRVALLLYYDGPISEEDRESASIIETELIAGLPDDVEVSSELVRVDAPMDMRVLDRWVYRRRE